MCFGGDYRFGFNTQQREDDIAGIGNHNTALFWEYDTRLGRRWNLDPKPQIFISDFVAFGNNPIVNVDIKGDKFKNAEDKKIASEIGKKFQSKVEKLTKQSNRLNDEMNAISLTEKSGDQSTWSKKNLEKYNSLGNEMLDVNDKINEISSAIEELATMGDDGVDQVFTFKSNGKYSYDLMAKFNESKEIEMSFGDDATLVHELTHGFQLFQGTAGYKIGYRSNNDRTDEIKAYQRQFIFDPSSFKDFLSQDKAGNIIMIQDFREINDDFIYNIIGRNVFGNIDYLYRKLERGPID
jgi:hypothetical protein